MWRIPPVLFAAEELVACPHMPDPRFSHPEWEQNSWYRSLRDTYLAGSAAAGEWFKQLPLEGQERAQAEFAFQQFLDASAPTNYLATNPAALQQLHATQGASLQAGMQQLKADLTHGRIGLSAPNAFEVGRNLAVTPGAVVFRNALIELIQYAPLTPTVYATPLLIVPPCINKFYILDLQAENSFVRHAVAAGHTVFLISWKNPHAAEAHFSWDDYLELGPIAALNAVQAITRKRRVNTLGFCVGGTILSSALAVLAARGQAPAASVTLLAALLDFSDVGQISVLVDERQVAAREAQFARGGIMPGREIAAAFSALRANDLIWNAVVNKYLLGNTPPPFDLLHWNGDATNLPGPMFAWYLRNLYLENRLKDGVLQGAGARIDLTQVTCPQYVLATREDHIVPWGSAYAALHILGGKQKRFVLGASGHVAGIVNPPAKMKRSHWVAPATRKKRRVTSPTRMSAAQWLESAQEVPGSWWPDWAAWLAQHGGAKVRAPARCGAKVHPALEPAPGLYVKELA